MSKDTHHESSLDEDVLEEAITYVIAASKGNQYKCPEGWDKNMKRSVRKRADRVKVRGVEVMYKKNIDEVRIIESKKSRCKSWRRAILIQHLGTLE